MSRYVRRRRATDQAPRRDPLDPPPDVAAGPCLDVWAPDVDDPTEAWWTARRRWRDALREHAAAVGAEPWQIENRCRTRRPYRATVTNT